MTRAQTETANLISIALTVVKVKAAALHYETVISGHAYTSSDVGELSHGQKQFVDILRCANLWIDRETAKFLATPLLATPCHPIFMLLATSPQHIG